MFSKKFAFTFTTSLLLFGISALANQYQCNNSPVRSPQNYSSAKVDSPDFVNINFALSPSEKYALRLYSKLVGVSVSVFDPQFQAAVAAVEAQDYMTAAKIVLENKNFLNIRVKNFAAPFTNKEFSNLEPLNDLQALIIGITRDELDARLILTGNLRYSGYRQLGLPPVERSNNDHYLSFDSAGYDFDRDLQRVNDQWEDMDVAAGAFTTRAWAKAYYDMGTNRRSIKYAFEAFLCAPIDSWKIRALPDHFVRRDVDRAPGGDPSVYQNTCRNCHAPMDAMGGAFAKVNFVDSAFSYKTDGVWAKMNNNSHFYPAGFVTVDDSWTNMMGQHPSVNFGWRGPLTGKGIASFAKTLADSSAFSRCLVTKVFKEVCGQKIQDVSEELHNSLTSEFEAQKYNLKYLFAKIATLDVCIAH